MPPGIARSCWTTGRIVTRDDWDCMVEGSGSWAILRRVPDLPFSVPASLRAAIEAAIHREGKLARALQALGRLAERDVLAVDRGPAQAARWSAAGARLTSVASLL